MKGKLRYPLVNLHSDCWNNPLFLLLGEYLVGNTSSIKGSIFQPAMLDYRSVSSNFWSSQMLICMVYLPPEMVVVLEEM